MSAVLPSDTGARLRERLAERWSMQRWRALGFTVLTLVLTPLFVGAALAVFLLVMPYGRGRLTPWMSGGETLILSFLSCLLGMGIAVVARHDPRRGPRAWPAVGLAAALWLGMAALGLATPLGRTAPWVFWPAFAALGLAVLAALLRAYEPAESYYLGWLGMFDDPFTFDDDLDRSHLAYGFAGAFVGLIVDAYEHLLRSAWLVLPLPAEELGAAAFLVARVADARGAVRPGALGATDPGATARALRLLVRLGVVRLARDGLRLTDDGRALADAAGGADG